MERRCGDLVYKLVVVDNVEGARQVAAKQARTGRRLPLIKATSDGRRQRKKGGDRRPARTETVLSWVRWERRR